MKFCHFLKQNLVLLEHYGRGVCGNNIETWWYAQCIEWTVTFVLDTAQMDINKTEHIEPESDHRDLIPVNKKIDYPRLVYLCG